MKRVKPKKSLNIINQWHREVILSSWKGVMIILFELKLESVDVKNRYMGMLGDEGNFILNFGDCRLGEFGFARMTATRTTVT